MAREVNVTTGPWVAVGTNASVPRWSMVITYNWTRDDGTKGTNTRTVTFPDVLTGIPAARLKDYMERILMAEARILAGVI